MQNYTKIHLIGFGIIILIMVCWFITYTSQQAKVIQIIHNLGGSTNKGIIKAIPYPRFLYYFWNVRTIYLDDCDLQNFDFTDLRCLKHLHGLYVSHTNLTDSQMKSICHLKNIQSLYVRECTNITDNGFQEIVNLKNLRVLDLTYTNCTDECLLLLKDLPKLERLYLRNLPINGACFFQKDGWKNIHILDLQGCTLNKDVFCKFSNMPALRYLTFSVGEDNQFAPSVDSLLQCKNLQGINIYGKNLSNLSDDGLSKETLERFRNVGIEMIPWKEHQYIPLISLPKDKRYIGPI